MTHTEKVVNNILSKSPIWQQKIQKLKENRRKRDIQESQESEDDFFDNRKY